MDAHIEKADYTEAINVFEIMQDNDVLPNTVTICTMMKLYLKVHEPHNAILIHGLFKKYNIPQDEYSFNTLINAYTENRQYDKAFQAFDEMIAKNYVPTVTTINTMMKLHLRLKQPHQAIKAHTLHKKYGVKENEYSFNILINAYTENCNYDKAFQAFDEMIAKNYIPNASTINTIMKLHLKLKQPHQAIKAHNSLFKKYGVKEDEYSFSILIKACTEAGVYNKAIEVFHQMQNRSDVRMENVTLSSVMHLYNKMNRPDKTIDTFELYQQYNIEPNIYAYSCLISAYEMQNNIKAACDTIRMLHSKGIKCTSYTFQPILRHYQRRADKRRFYRAWDGMIEKYNVRPDRYLYSIKDKLDQFRGPPLNERPCKFYQQYGNCRKGNDCAFKH